MHKSGSDFKKELSYGSKKLLQNQSAGLRWVSLGI